MPPHDAAAIDALPLLIFSPDAAIIFIDAAAIDNTDISLLPLRRLSFSLSFLRLLR